MSLNVVKVPCATCGELTVKRVSGQGSYCPEHKRKDAPRQNRKYRDPSQTSWAWRKLSLKARQAQDYCLDCGVDWGLSADHLCQAWIKIELGLSLTLDDVEVLCIACNSYRQTSAIGSPRFMRWLWSGGLEAWLSKNPNLIERVMPIIHELDPYYTLPKSLCRAYPGGFRETPKGSRAVGVLGELSVSLGADNVPSQGLAYG